MSQFLNKVSQPIRTSIFTQQKRFRGKINIQKPRPPHHERGKVEKFTLPIIPIPDANKPLYERCTNISAAKREKLVNPYNVIIARECLNWFKNSNMVGFFHVNCWTAEDQFEFAVRLKKANMYLKGYEPIMLDIAFKDTHYEPLLHLVQRSQRITYFVFSTETNAGKLYDISKKTPQITLLAGLVHGKLLSRNEFLKLGDMDLPTSQAGLVQVLRSASGVHLNQQLTHHQSTLVTRLKQIGTKNEEEKPCDVNN